MVTSFSSDFLFLANFHLFQRSDIPHFLQLSSNKWDWKKKSLFALPGLSRSLVPTRMQVKQCLHVQRPGLFHRPHLGQRPSLCHLWKMSSHTQRLTREIQQRYIPRKQITHETVLLEKVLVSKVYLLIVLSPGIIEADLILGPCVFMGRQDHIPHIRKGLTGVCHSFRKITQTLVSYRAISYRIFLWPLYKSIHLYEVYINVKDICTYTDLLQIAFR